MKKNKENRYKLSKSEVESLGLHETRNMRYRLSEEQVKHLFKLRDTPLVPEDIANSTVSNSPEKETSPFVLNAWNTDTGKMMDIDEYCSMYNLPRNDIRDYKLITHTGTPYYNIKFKDKEIDLEEVDLKEVINNMFEHDFVSDLSYPRVVRADDAVLDRLVFTDVHIGLDTNKEGNSLYAVPWDKEALMERADFMMSEMCKYDSGAGTLVIDDLGDLMDGWDGYTTRGGHKLPQNMSNKEAFEAAVEFKMMILAEASNMYDNVRMHSICNDNHSGSFGEIVNHAVKMLAVQKFDNVEVTNISKFIDHYFVDDYCFILTHGKDNKNLKFGFKPVMDGKQLERIDQYIKNNGIYNRAKWIEFSKGDSHQALFDMSSSDDFDYFNYPAFSPSSEWVQVNFKKGRAGFVIQNIDLETGDKQTTPIFFKQ